MPNRPTNQAEYARILSLVRRVCFLPDIDHESIAQDLWLRAVSQPEPLSYTTIKHYCYDCLRAYLREQKRKEDYGLTRHLSVEDSSLLQRQGQVSRLIDSADLTQEEKLVVFHRYYLNHSVAESSVLLGLSAAEISNLHWRAIEKLKTAARRSGL